MANYQPSPIKRVEIPKPYDTSKLRPLGIPNIEDRIIQQCILQILEPICEAKFYEHSYGFRKNRGTREAKARVEHLINTANLYYCVDIDIKGFFDNVNHSKLMKQIYSIGIKDKKVLSIISKMLKAPIYYKGKYIKSTKGVPQGGILSPLLSNIVLNELDHWVESNWVKIPTKFKYKNNGDKACALKGTNLKEMYIVRYADDFKIFCRTYGDAQKTYIAIKNWLKDRLKLEINESKSTITNLKHNSTKFLGFEIKAIKNKKATRIPYVAHSSIENNRKHQILKELKKEYKTLYKNPSMEQLRKINSMILGWHNYYKYASKCSIDFKWISFRLLKWHYKFLPKILKELDKNNIECNVFFTRYGHCNYKTYGIDNYPLFPIGVIKNEVNKCCSQIEIFTPIGRNKLIKDLDKSVENISILMMENPIEYRSVEYNDNRISRYTMQNGKCAISGITLSYSDIHCHHKIPFSISKDDSFKNLIIVHKDIHMLFHSNDINFINQELKKFRINKNKKEKFWELWKLCHN